jgi:malonyl-CoA decarboxylase
MSTGEWISRAVGNLLTGRRKEQASDMGAEPKAPKGRRMQERLEATLRKDDEAMSPRKLRQLQSELQSVLDPRVSEVEGGHRAREMMVWYAQAPVQDRKDFWLLLSESFAPSLPLIKQAQAHWEAALGTPEQAEAEVRMQKAMASPRGRIMQRVAVEPDGMRFLVDMRAELLGHIKGDKRLLPLEAELENIFTSWFDVAFLELRRISWDSPASLIEKLIQYEAVHDIRSWADVKNRLDSDRRCYGFFHAKLPNEPLIFVEVALLDHVAEGITPLLDEAAAPEDLTKATTAIFYSISNTQTGLKGVSFGDSLIKKVVESLKQEFARLKTFATLSPIPGFRAWLPKHAAALIEQLDDKIKVQLGNEIGYTPPTAEHVLGRLTHPLELADKSSLRDFLQRAVACYLTQMVNGQPVDPVARFHLGNGARVERINWAGDPSAKGLKQSYGFMVNYLYDLKQLDRHREQMAQGRVPASRSLQALVIR